MKFIGAIDADARAVRLDGAGGECLDRGAGSGRYRYIAANATASGLCPPGQQLVLKSTSVDSSARSWRNENHLVVSVNDDGRTVQVHHYMLASSSW